VADRNGNLFEFAFVYLTSSEMYHIVLGRNPDGSDRVESVETAAPLCFGSPSTWGSSNWADEVDSQETVRLPPLVELEEYHYNQQQRALLEAKGSSDTTGRLVVSPAYVPDVDERYCPYVLKSSTPPSWVKVEDVSKAFAPYSSTPGYPTIRIAGQGVYVTFCSGTREAQFALHMMRKLHLRKEGREAWLIFNFASRAEIERRPKRRSH
jgi:hypothetical protein